ncbi:High affinity cAMP-specific 3',5'-cyclic phosphodiesterase 7A [Blyttiomyces sp. JEL0837]|nr:High affinity cAMP-specific 3',5'-cyclic phosphodiesterase 7A [Blyttiomyces sp. JEL0837]
MELDSIPGSVENSLKGEKGENVKRRTRTLSMAYLQDAMPYFNQSDSDYEKPSRRAHSPSSPSSPSHPMGSAMESHLDAALRLKHARFSRFTLGFVKSEVEDDYSEYFWARTMGRWRLFVMIAGSIIVGVQIAGLLGKNGDGLVGGSITDWIVVAVAAILPILLIAACTYWISNARMSRWIHYLSLLFLIFIGPVVTIIRYTNPHLHPSPTALAVSSPLYIVCLVSSVFFLRLRFVHTLAATLVAGPTWYAVFGAMAAEAVDQSYILSAMALFFACIVTCFISYDQERSLRIRYLSDTRFLSITRNLQSQLDGLERSLLAASGQDGLTPADLDSPLEKAMLAVRSLLMDATVKRDHKAVLDLVMACLSSPNLLTPDLDLQLREGQVHMDDEQEKWLFNEIARRKSTSTDPADLRKQAMIIPSSLDDVEVEFDAADFSAAPAAESSTEVAMVPSVIALSRRGSAASILTPTATLSPSSITEFYNHATIPLLARIPEFNFPIFEFADSSSGHPLLVMAHHLCVTNGLVGRLGLNLEKFINCMATIEGGYHADLAFHNSLHAADVLHCINYLVSKPTIKSIFTDLETLAIYLAAIIHDFDHPGVNNNFLIAAGDKKAILYNDKSVLENHHCAAAFEVLSRPQCAFLNTLDRGDYKTLRESVVEMVLATDLAQHFSLLTMFKKKVLTADTFDPLGTREDRTLLMQMLMKCADVSNPTKAWPEYGEWINRITEEWYVQGDREKSLGLPISPFMNRDGPNASNPASAQTGFINFIVAPLFDAFGAWTNIDEIRRGLETNKARWAPSTPATPPANGTGNNTNSSSNNNNNNNNSGNGGNNANATGSNNSSYRRNYTRINPPRRNKSYPALPGISQDYSDSDSASPISPMPPALNLSSPSSRGGPEAGPRSAAPASPAYSNPFASPTQAANGRIRRKSGPAGWLTLDENSVTEFR